MATLKNRHKKNSYKPAIISLILLLLIAGIFSLRGQGYKQAFFGWLYERRLEVSRKQLDSRGETSWEQRLSKFDYPRTANMFLQNTLSEEEARSLARYDMLILGMQHQAVTPHILTMLKELNPDIILLAYTDPIAFPENRLLEVEPQGHGPWTTWGEVMREENYLLTNTRDRINIWLETPLVNLVSRVPDGRLLAEWKAEFYAEEVLGSGLWDGVFFDTTWPTINWINPHIDYNLDGVVDDQTTVNSEWVRGLNKLFEELRPLVGDEYLLIGNDQGTFFEWVNGRMFEDFPNVPNGGWEGSMREYAFRERTSYPPDVTIFNSSTLNTGNQDLEFMRFTLGSALMGSAFYNYDFGNEHRSNIWWYPEYDLPLGFPREEPKVWREGKWQQPINWEPGIYRREFNGGAVIVNSSEQTQLVQPQLRGYAPEVNIEPRRARFLKKS